MGKSASFELGGDPQPMLAPPGRLAIVLRLLLRQLLQIREFRFVSRSRISRLSGVMRSHSS